MPFRKRTALVDQRISRSRLSIEANPQELLEAQHALTNPRRAISPIPETRALDQQLSAEPSVSALGLGDPSKTEANEPQSLSTQETPTTILSEPVSQAEPSFASPIDADGPPSFAEPDDSDNEDGNPNDNSFENDASATMQYLSSVDDAPEDQPISGAIPASATAGLKRAGSGETSRLRGPRGEHHQQTRVGIMR